MYRSPVYRGWGLRVAPKRATVALIEASRCVRSSGKRMDQRVRCGIQHTAGIKRRRSTIGRTTIDRCQVENRWSEVEGEVEVAKILLRVVANGNRLGGIGNDETRPLESG